MTTGKPLENRGRGKTCRETRGRKRDGVPSACTDIRRQGTPIFDRVGEQDARANKKSKGAGGIATACNAAPAPGPRASPTRGAPSATGRP